VITVWRVVLGDGSAIVVLAARRCMAHRRAAFLFPDVDIVVVRPA
jgi:hypothetical protein